MTPELNTPTESLRLLAVDLETTGLSRVRDRVLAVGWVPVDGARIDLSGARRYVIRDADPGEAVTIHGLTHDDLERGRPLAGVLAELRRALEGRALLAHYAPFDTRFLDAAYRSLGEPPLRVPVVCTLDLQRRLLLRNGQDELPKGALRLWRSREHFGLPRSPAHDALADAVACAELYLAQTAELAAGRRRPLTLRDVRRRDPWWRRLRRWWRRLFRRVGGRRPHAG